MRSWQCCCNEGRFGGWEKSFPQGDFLYGFDRADFVAAVTADAHIAVDADPFAPVNPVADDGGTAIHKIIVTPIKYSVKPPPAPLHKTMNIIESIIRAMLINLAPINVAPCICSFHCANTALKRRRFILV